MNTVKTKRHCTVDFTAGVSNQAEECHLNWTTYANIKMWFDCYDGFLIEFGFGSLMEDGSFFVCDEQNKTSLSMDGTKQNKEGHPLVTFYNGLVPVLRAFTSKTLQSTTMLTGNNALGDVIPPNFQFSTMAKSAD